MISQRSSGCITHDIPICSNNITKIIWVYHSWYMPFVTTISEIIHVYPSWSIHHRYHPNVSTLIYHIYHNDITEIIRVYHSWHTASAAMISRRSSGCITHDVLHMSQRYHKDHPSVSLMMYSSCHNDITKIIRVYHSWCTPAVTTISQRSSECINHDIPICHNDITEIVRTYHSWYISICHNDITEIIRVYHSWYTHLQQQYHEDHLSISFMIYAICHNDIRDHPCVSLLIYPSQISSKCINLDIPHLPQRYHGDHSSVSLMTYCICCNDITEIIRVYHSWHTASAAMISRRTC